MKEDVIPTLAYLIKCIRADAVTSDCTKEMLDRGRVLGALEIRRLMLKYGVEEGWRRAGILFGQPVMTVTRLDRELTDEERGVLESSLGLVFDSRGHIIGGAGLDNLQLGDDGPNDPETGRRGAGGSR